MDHHTRPGRAPVGAPAGKIVAVLLVVLLLFFFAWDLRAVLTDNRPGATVSDTTLADVALLSQQLRNEGLSSWFQRGHVKGPLAALLVAALLPLVGDLLLAARLLSVLLHLLLLTLLFFVARRLTSRAETGLLAVVLCATVPMQYGWFRMDFHDPLVAVALLLCLQLMGGDLSRRSDALKLGLVGGIGLLSKLSFPVFVALPGLWFAITRLRRGGRRALHLLAAVLLALLVASWWLIPSWGSIVENIADSSQDQVTWLGNLQFYLLQLPGAAPFLLGAVAASVVAWRSAELDGDRLVLWLASLLGPLALFVVLFDQWSRYLLPLYPVAGLLLACGITGLGGRIARRWPAAPLPAVYAALALALLAQYCYFNVAGITSEREPREFFLGMVSPDTRPYQAYPSAVKLVRRRGLRVVELAAGPHPEAWIQRGYGFDHVSVDQAGELLAAGKPVALVLAHTDADPLRCLASFLARSLQQGDPTPRGGDPANSFLARREVDEGERKHNRWIAARSTKLLRSFADPDGVNYSVILLR